MRKLSPSFIDGSKLSVKTELLLAGTTGWGGSSFPSLQLAGDTIRPSQHHMLECLELSSQPTSVSRNMLPTSARPASIYHLRRLRHIRRTLSKEAAATLVHAFVTSRVDYCNVVFAGAPKTVTNKLQRVLNAAARVVSSSSSSSSSSSTAA